MTDGTAPRPLLEYLLVIVKWRKVVALSPDSEVGRTAAENVRLIETYVNLNNGTSKGP